MSTIADMATLVTLITSNIYLADEPDTPDNCLTFRPTGGFDTLHCLGSLTSDYAAEQPTFQIRVRHEDPETALEWCDSLKAIYNGLVDTEINDITYLSVFMQGNINPLGKDDRGRAIFTLNFVAKKKE